MDFRDIANKEALKEDLRKLSELFNTELMRPASDTPDWLAKRTRERQEIVSKLYNHAIEQLVDQNNHTPFVLLTEILKDGVEKEKIYDTIDTINPITDEEADAFMDDDETEDPRVEAAVDKVFQDNFSPYTSSSTLEAQKLQTRNTDLTGSMMFTLHTLAPTLTPRQASEALSRLQTIPPEIVARFEKITQLYGLQSEATTTKKDAH